MRQFAVWIASVALMMLGTSTVQAQSRTDLYHVHFAKAAPGEAAALGETLRAPDPKAAMPGHFLLLRHQHGDDWDYALIRHLGTKTTVEITPPPPPAVMNQGAWHEDTFVAGPPWAEFAKAMGVTGGTGGVYAVSVWRAVPGHREQLEKALSALTPGSKVPSTNVLLLHVEGGAWQYLALSRYNSWQDFAADQAPPAAGSGTDPWSETRRHGAFHRDTIADQVPQK